MIILLCKYGLIIFEFSLLSSFVRKAVLTQEETLLWKQTHSKKIPNDNNDKTMLSSIDYREKERKSNQ